MEDLSDSESSSDIITTLCVLNMTMMAYLLYKNNRSERRFWVREIFKKRKEQGSQENLVQEMRSNDTESHFRYFRMSKEEFDELLVLVKPFLYKPDSRFRKSISPEEKLSLTLRFLASGDSQTSLSFTYRLGRSTICKIIKETCQAIWITLSPLYLKMPTTSQDWLNVERGFSTLWNLPHCVGALDGKHVIIECPPNSGSRYYNYKGTYSIVLMALCDAQYKFTMVDIGAYGSQSDGGIFSHSSFGFKLNTGRISLPDASPLPNSNKMFPYYIAADEAFPLSQNIMRPYPGKGLSLERKVFNYRLSRGRRVIENAFGILSARWRIYRKPIKGKPENIDEIIKATVCLHNYLIMKDSQRPQDKKIYASTNLLDSENTQGEVVEGQWHRDASEGTAMQSLKNVFRSNKHSVKNGKLRDMLASYLNVEGKVDWQIERVTRG